MYHIQCPLRGHKTILKVVKSINEHMWRLWAWYTVKNGWLPQEYHQRTVDALLQLMKEDYK